MRRNFGHGTWDALLEKTLRAGVLTIMAGEADEWWWRVRWRIVVEAMEEGGRMGEGSGDGLSIVEERPSGVWRRLRGGGGEIS